MKCRDCVAFFMDPNDWGLIHCGVADRWFHFRGTIVGNEPEPWWYESDDMECRCDRLRRQRLLEQLGEPAAGFVRAVTRLAERQAEV